MATNYPSGLDSFTIPTSDDTLGSSTPTHTEVHNNEVDAIEAIQAKLGINNSTVTGSIDYRVNALEILTGSYGTMVDEDAADYYTSAQADTVFASAAQGALADSALQSDNIGVSVQAHSAILDATTASFLVADETKLDNVFLESGNDGLIILTRGNPTVDYNTAATDNLVEWNVQDQIDTDTYTHSTSTNPSRISVDVAGRYIIKGHVVLNGATTGTVPTRWQGKVKVRKNGTTALRGQFHGAYLRMTGSANFGSLPFDLIVDLAANDYIEILIDRLNGVTGSVNSIAGTNLFTMQRLF